MTGAAAAATFDVRLVLPAPGADATAFERLHRAGITTEGYGAGRVIAVQRVVATTDIDALVEARERIRRATGHDPLGIVSVRLAPESTRAHPVDARAAGARPVEAHATR